MRCRHNRNWIIAGGYWLWCYECGAIRVNSNKPEIEVRGHMVKWVTPVGIGGANPAMNKKEGH